MFNDYKRNIVFVVVTVLAIIISIYLIIRGYQSLSTTFEHSQQELAVQLQRQHELTRMYGAARERSVVLLQMSVQNDAFALDELRQKMRDLAAVFIQARHKLKKINQSSSRWVKLNKQLGKKVAVNSVLQNKVADLFAEGRKEQAESLMIKKVVLGQAAILATIRSMDQLANHNVVATMSLLHNRFLAAQRDFRVVAIIGLILFTLAFVLLLLSLLRGETRLSDLLRRSESRYKTIVDSINYGIVSMDEKGVISRFNHAAEKIFGYREKEMIGRHIRILLDKQSYSSFDSYIKKVAAATAAGEIELQGQCKDGSSVILSVVCSDTKIAGEQRFSGILRDITAKKARHERLLKYRDVFKHSENALAFITMHGVYQMVNDKYLVFFNKSEAQVIGHTINEVVGEKWFNCCMHHFQQAVKQKKPVHTFQWFESAAGSYYLSVSYKPYYLPSGDIDGVFIAISDITAQKKAQDELAKASKLESVGVLAGGIAHDFNNLLAGIMGNIEMAMRCLTDTDIVKRYLQTSSRACQRAAGLTQQLLTFSKGGEPVKKNADIIEVIRESTEFSLHGSNINYHFEKPQGQCLVSIDSGQISQVIQNLIINARHAMPDGGDIFIRCERVRRIAEMPAPDSAASKQVYIKISVEDTGTGIDEKDLESIFDPYFTTRKSGSGLGLALSYSIMQKHQGYIFVHSTPGQGSCFTLYLPEVRSQQAYRNEVAKVIEKSTTHKRIMLMDDDEMIREIGEAMLEDLGYEVVQAENGEQAMEKYKIAQQHNNPIDCIIMDLTIPGGMGGKEAIIEVLKINPQAKAIVSSGYSSDPIMANYTDYGFKNAISKPYNLDELSIALSAVFSVD